QTNANQQANAITVPESQSSLQFPTRPVTPQASTAGSRGASPGGALGDAIRNVQRYTRGEAFENQGGGGGGDLGPLDFDTKGVEFGPWIRRFIAQVRRNWDAIMPYAAMSNRGHVAISFNVHKDGSLTDIAVVRPSAVDPFNTAAYGALAASNPTV